MNESHLAYLSLGSNIQPEISLVRAVHLLGEHGRIDKISSAWESKSVGAEGPDYLNACLSLSASLSQSELKETVISSIEVQLGRKRTKDKFSPRTIDIDIVIFDDRSCHDKFWEQAYVVIPLAEIYPTFENPVTHESIQETATRLRREFRMEMRAAVLSQFKGSGLRS